MGMSPISGLQTPPTVPDTIFENAVDKNIKLTMSPDGLPPSEPDTKVGDTHVPDPAPTSNTKMSDLAGLANTAGLSPGAWLAILCVKESQQEIEKSTEELLTHSDKVVQKLNEEASNIMKGAVAQLVCSVVTSAASITLSSVAGAKSMKLGGLTEGNFAAAKAAPDILNSIGRGTEQIGNSVGGFVSSIYQSKNKEVQATEEQAKTAIESIKNHMQAQKELVSKCLDFYSSMQANQNQTRAKIMG